MSDVILILNAGSSSLKFSVFRDSDPPELLLRGQLESLLTEPRFVARDAHGKVVDEHAWPAGSTLGHQGAIEFLFAWGQRGKLGELRLLSADSTPSSSLAASASTLRQSVPAFVAPRFGWDSTSMNAVTSKTVLAFPSRIAASPRGSS